MYTYTCTEYRSLKKSDPPSCFPISYVAEKLREGSKFK